MYRQLELILQHFNAKGDWNQLYNTFVFLVLKVPWNRIIKVEIVKGQKNQDKDDQKLHTRERGSKKYIDLFSYLPFDLQYPPFWP